VKNIIGSYTKGLDAVCALKPIVFTYNGKGGTKSNNIENVSIIAQEAKNIFPECVSTYSEKLNVNDTEVTEFYNWNGNALIYALVNAIKELNQKIIVLEQKFTPVL